MVCSGAPRMITAYLKQCIDVADGHTVVENTGSLLTSEVKQLRARIVLGWGTAWEVLRVLSAFFINAAGVGLSSQTTLAPRLSVAHVPRANRKTTPVGFEPTQGDPIGLAGRRLSHSAKVSSGCVGFSSCCLLYTSPSPRDLSTSRMPSSA